MAATLAIDGGEKVFNGAFPAWPQFEESTVQKVADVLRSGKVNYWTGKIGMERADSPEGTLSRNTRRYDGRMPETITVKNTRNAWSAESGEEPQQRSNDERKSENLERSSRCRRMPVGMRRGLQ